MTYTFKLARRLAASWVVLALVVAAACAPGEPLSPSAPLAPPPPSPRPIDTTVVVYPSSATLAEGAQLRFTAFEKRGTADSTASADIDWTATGGTVDSTGLYRATTVGQYTVTATARRSRKSQSAVVTTTTISATLARIVVSPDSVSLQPGQSQGFAASGLSTTGTTMAAAVTWRATGGTISTSGAYTAPSTAGRYLVIGQQSSGTLADTSVVRVSASAPVVLGITVSPATASLTANGTLQLAATARMSDSSTAAASVTWSADLGAVSSAGLYTASGGAGTARVIARQVGGALADTAILTIAAAAPTVTLTGVTLAPASVTLAAGGTQQFSATGRYSDGTTGSVSVTWIGTGGTASSTGLYTAGTAAGTYRVIAASVGGFADTSSVTITPPPPTAVGLVLSPGTASLLIGATQQFTVTTRMSDGSTAPASATYTASGGAITTAGLYTAGSTAGTYQVIARSSTTAFADTTNVSVTVPAPTATAVVVSPATVSLTAGATQQFAASARLSNGTSGAVSVSWSSSGGAVTPSGLYTSPSIPGIYQVIAQQVGSTLADTALVTVAPSAPTGVTVLMQASFDVFPVSQGSVSVTKRGGPALVDRVATFGRSANTSIRFTFPAGSGVENPELGFGGLPDVSDLYLQFYLYYPNGTESPSVGPRFVQQSWPFSSGPNNKFVRAWNADYNGAFKMGASTWPSSSPGDAQVGVEYLYNAGTFMWGMGQGPDGGGVPEAAWLTDATRGRWIQVRIRMKGATAANNDGITQIWRDGVLIQDARHLPNYPLGDVPVFKQGYILGASNTGVNVQSYVYLDDLVISTGGFPQ